MPATNLQVKLVKRPAPGLLTPDCFRLEAAPIASPGPGEVRVKVAYVSIDPAQRGWVNDTRSYVPPVGIGEVMRAYAVGMVDASGHPSYKAGDAVQGLFGVQQYAIMKGSPRVSKVDLTKAPLERWVGGLGMPGWTAYFGLLEVGRPKEGDTVVVSAASGAVGSIVGQIAKIKGCRAVGIAGGAEKCRYVRDVLGFDACVDYKAGNLAEGLREACPRGIDVDFENVGGEILETVLSQMNPFGRVAICGMISAYNATDPATGPRNFRAILTQRLRVQGLIVSDWNSRVPEAIAALAGWHDEGRLKMREDVRTGGLAAFVDTLNLLYTGGNNGKLVLKV
ncbi:MAG: NADP-dependent oxidoreductase [Hyphomicrobiaceae bacterium]|nr:NADP-dependent oxidoreductase [Hyphomicrobiaceae bacterium]